MSFVLLLHGLSRHVLRNNAFKQSRVSTFASLSYKLYTIMLDSLETKTKKCGFFFLIFRTMNCAKSDNVRKLTSIIGEKFL